MFQIRYPFLVTGAANKIFMSILYISVFLLLLVTNGFSKIPVTTTTPDQQGSTPCVCQPHGPPPCVCEPRVLKSGINLDIITKLLTPTNTYYDAKYWEFQRPMGEIGGTLEQWKFREYIPTEANCLDFGAGGGFLLHGLTKCKGKRGIELNPHAIQHASQTLMIDLNNDIAMIPDDWADVIISNHALEHVLCPWCELKRLLPKLKKETGRVIFVIPAAGRSDDWTGAPDVNFHIYSWSPKTLGNLFASAGFIDIQVDILAHQWPDNPMSVYQEDGEMGFIQKGQQKNREGPLPGCEYQIRVVASRPS